MYYKKRFRKAAAAYMEMQAAKRASRRRRPLEHGDLRLLVLSLIAEAPRHGYDLIAEIEARTEGSYKPSPGVMYPTLAMIQDLGFAKVKKQEGKRVFYITPDGEAELESQAESLARIEERLLALREASEARDPTDVRAASQTLRHTVFKVVAQAWPDTTNYEQIVAILNHAQQQISELGSKGPTPNRSEA